MDSWLLTPEGPLGTLVPPIADETPPPAIFWNRIQTYARSGRIFGEQIPCMKQVRIPRSGSKRLAALNLPLEDEAGTWELAGRSIFWFFAMRPLPQRHEWRTWLGARGQRDLTQCLAVMQPRYRKNFYKIVDRADPTGEWRGVYLGAAAVARTIIVLSHLGIPVALPKVSLDIKSKVDLLAHYHGLRLLIQLKSDANAVRSVVRPLLRPSDAVTKQELVTGRKLHKLSRRHGLNAIPLIIHVGRHTGFPWELERSGGLRRSITALLRQL